MMILFFGTLDLPGFTRSVFKRDHALITPESHVFSPLPDWYGFIRLYFLFIVSMLMSICHALIFYPLFRINTLGAYLISPAIGAHFTMYLANMQGKLFQPFARTLDRNLNSLQSSFKTHDKHFVSILVM